MKFEFAIFCDINCCMNMFFLYFIIVLSSQSESTTRIATVFFFFSVLFDIGDSGKQNIVLRKSLFCTTMKFQIYLVQKLLYQNCFIGTRENSLKQLDSTAIQSGECRMPVPLTLQVLPSYVSCKSVTFSLKQKRLGGFKNSTAHSLSSLF